MKTKVMLIAAILMITTGVTLAADWPQWRGPNRDGKSSDTGLLKEWPKDGPALAWKITGIGGGYSAASIAAGRIFGMGNRGDDEVVWAMSETDGKELWVTRLGPAFSQRASQGREGPACTPTVDGERLYVLGLGGDVACLQVKDGKIIWQRSLTDDFGGRVPTWSYRESPLIDGDKVICTPGGEDAILAALNKLTGETIWKSKMPEATASAETSRPAGGAGDADRGSSRSSEGGGADRGRSRPGGGGSGSETAIAGTKDPGLFNSEHFSMRAFSCKVPNGRYLAKLYFAETYEGIIGPGQRVFSYNVQGHEIKDFDVWVKAGGPRRAYIETVPVEVTNGEFRIVFTPKVENPAIKAIEIIPQVGASSAAATVRINAGSSDPFKDSSGYVWQPDSGFEGGMTSQMSGGFRRYGGRRGDSGGRRGGFGGPRRAGAAYASAIAIDFDGQRQYVQLISNTLVGFAASDGKFLWRYDKPANHMGINCSTPLFHDSMVFASSAYGAGGGLIKLSKDADGSVKAEEVYDTTDMQNHHGGMILLDGYLYGASGGNEGGALACLDFKTGKVMWDQRQSAGRRAKGSLALADGRLYYRMESGTMLLIEPSPKQYIELGRFEQPDRSEQPAWPHPVIANGKLYVRDQDVLLCYDVKAK
ncbi:MAG: serine/threonine protein kinase [Phycisphaerae bacterium SM1_79]|nr:MAG: serine/threonine protein kinase [Phycisphaerae bacterium SM1_79]